MGRGRFRARLDSPEALHTGPFCALGLHVPTQRPLSTWTPQVCRIIAFYGFWAIILPTFGGLGSSFLGLPYRILNINYEKELLRGLWVYSTYFGAMAGI